MSPRRRTTDIPLLPREVLFGNPDRAAPKVSHDGKQLAFLAPLAGVLNVWVALADEPEKARAVTHDTDRGIRIYFWGYTNRHILYLQDKGGDENWRVYAVDLATDETRDLTPFEKVAAQVQEVSKEHPEEILVGLNNRDARYHDVHRVNIRTGELTLLQENPDFLGFITDDDFNLRFAVRMTADGGEEVLKPGPAGSWEPYRTVAMEDTLTSGHVGFDKSGAVEYRTESRGRDTAALVAVDLKTEVETVLAQDDRVDVGGVMTHPTEKHRRGLLLTYWISP